MKKSVLLVICVILAIVVCSGFNSRVKNANDVVVSNESHVFFSESKILENVKETELVKVTERPAETSKSVTKRVETTTLHTSTKKAVKSTQNHIVKNSTTKITTTNKVTTTKKATTTKAYFCDEGGTHHSCSVGPIGWVNSYEEAQDKALEYIADHDTSGNFTVKECYYCGVFTAVVTLD